MRLYSNPKKSEVVFNYGIARQIKNAISSAGRLTKFKNECLIQSLAARRMLKRRRIESDLHFGVKKDKEKGIIAHSWLSADDLEIVQGDMDFKEIHLVK